MSTKQNLCRHVIFSQNCCFVANFVNKALVDDSTNKQDLKKSDLIPDPMESLWNRIHQNSTDVDAESLSTWIRSPIVNKALVRRYTKNCIEIVMRYQENHSLWITKNVLICLRAYPIIGRKLLKSENKQVNSNWFLCQYISSQDRQSKYAVMFSNPKLIIWWKLRPMTYNFYINSTIYYGIICRHVNTQNCCFVEILSTCACRGITKYYTKNILYSKLWCDTRKIIPCELQKMCLICLFTLLQT